MRERLPQRAIEPAAAPARAAPGAAPIAPFVPAVDPAAAAAVVPGGRRSGWLSGWLSRWRWRWHEGLSDLGPLRRVRRSTRPAPLHRSDRAYVDALRASRLVESTPGIDGMLWLMAAMFAAAVAWAALTRVDVVTRAAARVVPEGRQSVIASADGGLLAEVLVREGDRVSRGQPVAQLALARVELPSPETEVRWLALKGSLARLRAEVSGSELRFPDEVAAVPRIVEAETESYRTRRQVLAAAAAINRRSIGVIGRELDAATAMAADGLLSEFEVMRLRREVHEQQRQMQERVDRFRQEAAAELVRVRTELAQLEEQRAGRADAARRTVLTSPVDGTVDVIHAATVGSLIAAGAPVMAIAPVPVGVLVEVRVSPQEIGLVRLQQRVQIRFAGADGATDGALQGTVESISSDVIGDPGRPGTAESPYHRVLVRAADTKWTSNGQELLVQPGMTGRAEIRTHERSVLGLLLRPLPRGKEAFRDS